MKKLLVPLFLLCSVAYAQTAFNCGPSGTTWNTSTGTACGALLDFQGAFFALNGNGPGSITGNSVLLMPSGAIHQGDTLIYRTRVSTQAFSTHFTFLANGWNLAFMMENNTQTGAGPAGSGFAAGAGCEGGFYQGFTVNNIPPNNMFVINLDQQNFISGNTFGYSNVQLYQQAQTPCAPNDNQPFFWQTTKVSTSPVPLNSPTGTIGGITGDTYDATITYDGSTVTLNLFDITAGGACPGASCFTKTWSNVSVPALTGSTTAYAGLSTATNQASTAPLYVYNWSFTATTPTASPGSAPTSSGGTPAANPTFSPAAGSYASTQTVTLSSTSTGANICYMLASSCPTVAPTPDNQGHCATGTTYTSPITVSSTQQICATAGTTWTSNSGGLPSGLATAAYTIGGLTPAAQPAFSPAAGPYVGTQSVSLSTTSGGAIICYTTNGTTPATNASTGCTTGTLYSGAISVPSSVTINAVAGGTSYSDSTVGSAAYTINAATAHKSITGKATITGIASF
jgi:Chitobiase/beta-hexosaminidase C-terminal domain